MELSEKRCRRGKALSLTGGCTSGRGLLSRINSCRDGKSPKKATWLHSLSPQLDKSSRRNVSKPETVCQCRIKSLTLGAKNKKSVSAVRTCEKRTLRRTRRVLVLLLGLETGQVGQRVAGEVQLLNNWQVWTEQLHAAPGFDPARVQRKHTQARETVTADRQE